MSIATGARPDRGKARRPVWPRNCVRTANSANSWVRRWSRRASTGRLNPMARKFTKAQLAAARAEIARRDTEFQAKCEAHRLDPSLPQPVLDMDYTPAMMEAWNIDSCAELDAWAAKDAARQAAEDAAKPKPPPEPYRPPPTKSVDQRTKDRYEKLMTSVMDRLSIELSDSGEALAIKHLSGALAQLTAQWRWLRASDIGTTGSDDIDRALVSALADFPSDVRLAVALALASAQSDT